MRLKYQLRGLGIGIILTAALLMIFSDDGEASAKTEDAVVMASTEAEMPEDMREAESVTTSQEEEKNQEENSTVVVEETSAEEKNSLEEETEITSEEEQETETVVEEKPVVETTEEALAEESEESETALNVEFEEVTDNAANTVKIKIVSGDDSGTVARKLQTAGLVDNASEFDAYLMQHGYDKRIAVGEKEIPKDATWLEIAEKISRR